MKPLVCCPYVHLPSFTAMWATLHPDLQDGALVLDNRARNLGAAGSRNVAGRVALEHGCDWVVEISPVTRFGPPGGLDFLEQLDRHPDAWVVQSATPVNWHCIAWSLRIYERVGWWDENFWPVYGEDGDMSRRIHLAMAADDATPTESLRVQPTSWFRARWECVEIDAWVTMHGHSMKLAGIQVDHGELWAYYARKWGGPPGHETYAVPFNDKPLSYWPTPTRTT